MITIRIQTDDFDASQEKLLLQSVSFHAGAVVEFTGCVRALETSEAHLHSIYLEHYPGMTEKSIHAIATKVMRRWPVLAVTVIHRVGDLKTGDNIVYVGVSSIHRKEALQSIDYIMDFLKNDVPIWKKEVTSSSTGWVEQKQADVDARSVWSLRE